jgi:hypothetical protein
VHSCGNQLYVRRVLSEDVQKTCAHGRLTKMRLFSRIHGCCAGRPGLLRAGGHVQVATQEGLANQMAAQPMVNC